MHEAAFPLTLADRMTRRHFRNSLPKERRSSFDEAFLIVLKSEAAFAADKATRQNTVMLACALCTYRAWIALGLETEEAKRRVGEAVSGLWKRSMLIAMWAMSAFTKDTFEAVRSYTAERSASHYGPSFEIDFADIEDGFVSEVRVCGFQAFLKRHGATELLELFCEWDRNWIDALPKGISFSRSPTLAQGGSSCRFEFRRE